MSIKTAPAMSARAKFKNHVIKLIAKFVFEVSEQYRVLQQETDKNEFGTRWNPNEELGKGWEKIDS